ncbi:hypothetical protein LCGC14_0826710 [marine sediment metagenome]|uniref:Uncharacterized protein n=1 Tax=marine sediment metagenome TaxID=412755 RepID=A0A0F9Q2E9_9ZZZZ
MTFNIFGFDFYWIEKCFGFWICIIKNINMGSRSLFALYYADGDLIINLFWFHLKGETHI